MYKPLYSGFVALVLTPAVLLSLTVLGVAVELNQSPPPAPADQPRLKPGDTLTVAAEGARLMTGSEVVGTVPKGQRIVVVEVRGAWVGTYVSVAGQAKAGWIEMAAFMPARPTPQPQVYTVARQVETPAAQSGPVYYSQPQPATVRDDYHIGYYIRHETDPNIHVWEPWRQ